MKRPFKRAKVWKKKKKSGMTTVKRAGAITMEEVWLKVAGSATVPGTALVEGMAGEIINSNNPYKSPNIIIIPSL